MSNLGCPMCEMTDLLQWETTMITDAMRGPSATISVKGSALESRFYRVSAFDWEELRSELRVARELWRTRGPGTYRFEFRWNCHCLPDFREWFRVDVRDKILVGVTRLTDGEAPASRPLEPSDGGGDVPVARRKTGRAS
jgi:hypothetical protein